MEVQEVLMVAFLPRRTAGNQHQQVLRFLLGLLQAQVMVSTHFLCITVVPT